ncbi:class I SAM-dependent methyltransferase [Nocardioides albus]|uniref:Cyclopropane-fatty-acyl-phospholipid synthase n=1 Tax=Nocardioides albus TaxID=1841 RepID=A0A7W5F7Z6_9ACTN|nr:class I SAM-dependent methyltransferase [Nocardioides albus]MBB3088362.1 cyclopropane-fatty-acyl-phospholipid synthase [Nocardioides albus]GGU41974.1 tuberculostearic acid methyltransferase UfaA1 [Nocardioides albus]
MTTIEAPTAQAAVGDRWPMLQESPTGPVTRLTAAAAATLFRTATKRLGISVSEDGSPADIVLHRPVELYARLSRHGLIGLGEAYMTGAWDAPELGETLTVLCRDLDGLLPGWAQRLRGVYERRRGEKDLNTPENAREHIGHHYDLSNDFFALFLDPTMSYSAGLFSSLPSTEDLALAQHRKIDRILDEAGVGAGTRLLEIGTGWGELALRAAARGAQVTSVTLSVEQAELARRRIGAAGLGHRVDIELCDYRAVEGTYDAVVSVEMIEAVGERFWPVYFAKIDEVLAPGGIAVIQGITMPHERMLATRNTETWITKYIFPGGLLPSTEAITDAVDTHTRLRVRSRLSFGAHYAETLRRWDIALRAQVDEVRALGFDETFLRMWHFYLEYTRAGFAADYIDVQQVTFTRDEPLDQLR